MCQHASMSLRNFDQHFFLKTHIYNHDENHHIDQIHSNLENYHHYRQLDGANVKLILGCTIGTQSLVHIGVDNHSTNFLCGNIVKISRHICQTLIYR